MGHTFEVTDSDLILDAPIIAVRRDTVRMPGGSLAHREVVEHFGAVAVAAVDSEGRIAMVKQWRQSVKRRLWELPAGLLDIKDEDPLECAKRELQEEAGLSAKSWMGLADLVTSPGFCEEAVRVYLATDLSAMERPSPADDEEADLSMDWVDLEEAAARVDSQMPTEQRNARATHAVNTDQPIDRTRAELEALFRAALKKAE
jgi:ADP-ribose pyrophosphatase